MNNQQYPLPEGWEWKPLSSLAIIVSGGTPSREVPDFWEPPLHAWVTPTDITGKSGRFLFDAKERISDVGLSNSSATMLPIGTILMTSRATLGEAKIARIPCCTNQGFKSLVPKSDVPSEYLYYLLQFFKEEYKKLGIGSTFLEVNKKDTAQFQLPVSPPSLRPKIANILCEVDDHIDSTLELIGKYEVTKQGLMSDLFSRGIDPATGLLRPSISEAPELYRDTPIGSLPKEWDVLPASLICERVIDCKNRTPPERDEGFAVVKTFNIKDGELVFDTLTFTDRLSFDIWTARGVPSPGDIVITREAPVGESFLIEENMPQLCLGQRTMLYRPDPNVIESDFMYFATRSLRFQKRLLDMAGGSTVGHVRVGDVKDMLFPIPSSVEQKAIAKNCTAINKKLRAEKAMLDKLKAHKAGLMRDLLTGKVPVSA
ncbi:restriction endonuclease subunit S [Aeromonas dhakensis]|uniref:restriction endonuclease subunit S n=1 Tax=Aeromonas dhakensis TaxID=196024 RepID=UPI003986EC87